MQIKTRLTIALLLTTLALVFFAPHSKAGPLSDCKPIIKSNGYPIAPDWVDGTQGRHVFFYCAAPAHEYTVGFSCRYDDCNPYQLKESFMKVLLATDRTAAINAEWAAHIRWTCDTPPDEPKRLLCVERAERAQVALDAALQGYVRPLWRVKANGTSLTRPAYTLTNGVVGTKEAARVAVGAVCDLSKPTAPATLGDIRAQWVGGPAGVVTICSKEK